MLNHIAKTFRPLSFFTPKVRITAAALLLWPALYLRASAPSAPDRTVVGKVTDSLTGNPVSGVQVYSRKGKRRALTDDGGVFTISIPSGSKRLRVNALGFLQEEVDVHKGADTLRIILTEAPVELDEFVVRPKKEKYSKRNNPAVDLMQTIRAARDEGNPALEPYYSYDRYEKLLVALNDYQDVPDSLKAGKTRKFFREYVDTAAWTGSTILDVMLREKLSTRIMSRDPDADKEIVRGVAGRGIDQAFNQQNITAVFEDVLRDVNLYDNDIILLQNRFVSPLSKIGPDFYKYHITDTVMVGGDVCAELSFAPHNPESMGFNGKIYVTVGDSARSLRRVTMRIPKAINLNYVDNIFISQNFRTDSLGKTHKTLDDMCLEMQVMPGTPKFFTHRVVVYDNFQYTPRHDFEDMYTRLGERIELDSAYSRPGDFWAANRMVPLSRAEHNLSGMDARLRELPWLYYTRKALEILEGGYVKTSRRSCFDFGPVNTLVSFNDVEGTRFRLGGLTTANLNQHLFARGYLAYGTKDRKLKYEAELEYSFPKKRYHSREFCRHGIAATYSYDLDMLGQHYLFTNADNIFLSLKRKESILVTYRRLAELSYLLELSNNFSVGCALRHVTQEATPWIRFVYPDGRSDRRYSQAYLKLDLRYAPGEKFIQGRTNRAPLNLDSWVFQLSHEIGPSGFAGSDFAINRTEVSVRKRLWFSAFGYTDIMLKGGMIWNTVPFPALLWPNANLSYTIQPESFSLMNAMEFANDRYLSWDFTYFGNGILFNRIPGIRKLKMREVVTFNGLMGGLSRRNNPAYNPSIYSFPEAAEASVMKSTPYMEIGCGLDNILTFLRIDYVWRLTYRDKPGIDRSGLRVSLHFSF